MVIGAQFSVKYFRASVGLHVLNEVLLFDTATAPLMQEAGGVQISRQFKKVAKKLDLKLDFLQVQHAGVKT